MSIKPLVSAPAGQAKLNALEDCRVVTQNDVLKVCVFAVEAYRLLQEIEACGERRPEFGERLKRDVPGFDEWREYPLPLGYVMRNITTELDQYVKEV